MLINYFKIAFRTLRKFKGYATINLLGLALGLTVGILILMYVLDEVSYDRFHTKGDRIYRVNTAFFTPGESIAGANETNGWPIGKVLEREFPEVEQVVYARGASFLLINHNDKRIRENIHFVSNEFLTMFSFPLRKGNPEKALREPYSVVITESMERKYFNGENALNKTITVSDTLNLLVTGVMADVPSNSHIQFDMLVSFATFERLSPSFSYDDGWGNINMRNYVLLKAGADYPAFAEKAKNIYTDRVGEMLKNWGVSAQVLFEPMNDIYLKSASGNSFGPLGSLSRLYLLSGIAAFIILLACINFINLATARSVYRAKEVGLRKMSGSSRQGLIAQFLSESFVLTALALLFALALTGLMLPMFNQLLGKSYQLLSLIQPSVLGGTLILMVLVSVLAGYYPAMVMSALRPAEVLKGKMQSSSRGIKLRRTLVVFQFVISATLVAGTFVVLNQLRFMQMQDLGFEKDEILVINAARAKSSSPIAFETFKNELKKLSIVEEVSYSNALPGLPGWQGQVAYPEGKSGDASVSVEYLAVDEAYIQTLGLERIAGNVFDKNHTADLNEGLILNESAVTAFGWASPEEAINKQITSPSRYPEGRVIGVVKDYHQAGLQQKIGAVVMDYNPGQSYLYAIRYKAADTQHLIAQANDVWNKTYAGYDFNYFFLNDHFGKQYQSEQRLANVFSLFAVVTIAIAAIGLIGLVSFMVVAKTKEIGVRKVLGADVFSITKLLSKEFIILVLVANVLAAPLTWYFANDWLNSFAYRTTLNPMLFVWAALTGVTVTLLAVSYQTIKAASADPVKSLRYE